jgi:hypothetical protein
VEPVQYPSATPRKENSEYFNFAEINTRIEMKETDEEPAVENEAAQRNSHPFPDAKR